jgi:acetylxylan esterase
MKQRADSIMKGGQIMDDAFCGGGDTNIGLSSTAIPIQASAVNMIKAAIFMGDPRHIPGLSYNVGTCQASGVRILSIYPPHKHLPSLNIADNSKFAPRPSGFQCPSASKIQSYCDAADPYCCNGNNAATHQGYGTEYGQAALTFVKSKLNASGGGTTPTTTAAGGTPTQTSGGGSGSGTVAHWGQCGGQGWTGGTVCLSPYTCQAANQWYSPVWSTI